MSLSEPHWGRSTLSPRPSKHEVEVTTLLPSPASRTTRTVHLPAHPAPPSAGRPAIPGLLNMPPLPQEAPSPGHPSARGHPSLCLPPRGCPQALWFGLLKFVPFDEYLSYVCAKPCCSIGRALGHFCSSTRVSLGAFLLGIHGALGICGDHIQLLQIWKTESKCSSAIFSSLALSFWDYTQRGVNYLTGSTQFLLVPPFLSCLPLL